MPKGTCIFNTSWVSNEKYKDWVSCSSTSNQFARCIACSKDIKITAGVEASLDSRAKGASHGKRFAELKQSKKSQTNTTRHIHIISTCHGG